VSAGQIDALYVDRRGLYYLFDFKRTKKEKRLNANDKGWAPRGEPPPCGLGPMAHLPDTPFQHYSLQASIYALMLAQTHGIDVGDRMFVLRMHADRAEHQRVQCRNLRTEARAALESEAHRLRFERRARPPPEPPGAAASGPACPEGASGSPVSEGEAGLRKRPRGAAPRGKEWKDGGWCDFRVAKSARTPATGQASKTKPAVRPKKGMRWDGVAGVWVAKGGQFGKRDTPTVSAEGSESRRIRTRR
jgi:hypothetical protein